MEQGIIFIRNSNFAFDTRLKKAVDAALEAGYHCLVLDWIREGCEETEKTLQLENGQVKVYTYDRVTPFGRGIRNLKDGMAFSRWIKNKLNSLAGEYSIIYACDYDVGRTCYKVAKKLSKKLIYDIFDYYSETHSLPKLVKNVVKRGEDKLIDRADAVIICHESRFHQIEGTHPKKCEVIHNTPAYDKTILDLPGVIKNPSDKFKVVYVGTLPLKGRLIQEVLSKCAEHKNTEFHFAGNGALQEFVAQKAQNSNNVFYYGTLDNRVALKLTSECDLVFAVYEQTTVNNQYSAPNKVYEAMALEKPIVACCGKYIDEMITSNKTGLTIAYDVDEFFEAVETLKQNPKMYNAFASNGARLYAEKYNWHIMKNKLQSLYRELTETDK